MYNKAKTSRAVRRKRKKQEYAMRRLVVLSMLVLLIFTVFAVYQTVANEGKNGACKPIHTSPAFTQDITGQAGYPTDNYGETEEPQQSAPADWRLLLVNKWNKIPSNYTMKLTELANGQAIDTRAYPDLQQMMDDCRAAGLSPIICSSYRSVEKQEMLYENKIFRLMAEGYSYERAKEEAGKVVAISGTSEHQTALALDIVDATNQNLDETQESTAVQKWLIEHSWEYGFVLRYPNGKSDITGIIYEPWHYRYVGRKAAREMKERDMCLEEYLEWLGTY